MPFYVTLTLGGNYGVEFFQFTKLALSHFKSHQAYAARGGQMGIMINACSKDPRLNLTSNPLRHILCFFVGYRSYSEVSEQKVKTLLI